ncbi:hypothetical protein ACVLV4_000441 [Rathayibacter agropyri]
MKMPMPLEMEQQPLRTESITMNELSISNLFKAGYDIEAYLRTRYPAPTATGHTHRTLSGEHVPVMTAPVITFGGVVLVAADDAPTEAHLEFTVRTGTADEAMKDITFEILKPIPADYRFVGLVQAETEGHRWLILRSAK